MEHDHDYATTPPQHDPELKISTRPRYVALLALLAISTLIGIASKIMSLPLNRIIELRYCQDYYSTHDPTVIGDDGFIPERLCKIDAVQQNLGWMLGTLETTLLACDIAITLPMGYVADKIGARSVLFLNGTATAAFLVWIAAVGYFRDVFTIGLILAGPILTSWGRGDSVLRSVCLALVAEIAENDAQRTAFLAYLTSVNFVTSFISPAFAGLLMERNVWLPVWLGILLILAALPLIRFLPKQRVQDATDDTFSARGHTFSEQTTSLLQADSQRCSESSTSLDTKERNPIRAFILGYSDLVTSNRAFRLLLATEFMTGFASATSQLLPRYISKRYGLSFARIGYLFTFKAAINILLLTVGIHGWTVLMIRFRKHSSARADLKGARLALVVSALGAVLIAASSETAILILALCIYCVGSVFPVFVMSLARSDAIGAMHSDNESRGYALLVLGNSLGTLLGIPLVTAIWVKGIGIGGVAMGSPYYVSAAGYSVAVVIMAFIPV